MQKFKVLILTILVILGFAFPSFAATQVDALIEKLVEKGILTKSESLELKEEIASDEKLMREDGFKQSLPEWVQNTKLKGDMRVRYQYERSESSTEARSRGRIRYRLGLESIVNPEVKVGAGLATGAEDPRATNVTMEDVFEKPDIRLDYAYGEYKPEHTTWFKTIVGKFPSKDYLWAPSDVLWDTDINPNGVSVNLTHQFMASTEGYFNGGVWVLEDNSTVDRPDPFMTYAQSGVNWKEGKLGAKAATTLYTFNGLKGTDQDHDSTTNTREAGGGLKYDFDSIGGSAEVSLQKPFEAFEDIIPIPIQSFAVFSDYIHNFDPNDNANGWSLGARTGDEKVVGKGQWQFKYIFARLGKDAWPDFLPDSDRLGGGTDIRAHEVAFDLGLNRNVILGLDYYQGRKIVGAKDINHLYQVDLNFKF